MEHFSYMEDLAVVIIEKGIHHSIAIPHPVELRPNFFERRSQFEGCHIVHLVIPLLWQPENETDGKRVTSGAVCCTTGSDKEVG